MSKSSKHSKPFSIVAGDKADHQIRLVQAIIQGQLTGDEFCQKLRPRGQLRSVESMTDLRDKADN